MAGCPGEGHWFEQVIAELLDMRNSAVSGSGPAPWGRAQASRFQRPPLVLRRSCWKKRRRSPQAEATNREVVTKRPITACGHLLIFRSA
eukprot:NODE_25524_length_584_cov_2.676149.p5 GENE.NODE_25524_length_584_cov_2.676149~~NODE_25524_length_584_cov_2.676149.p5  ORF type:complete len:89 (-),score=13.08 NODE_25524_length_584_cov_2.676149:177-443(-)